MERNELTIHNFVHRNCFKANKEIKISIVGDIPKKSHTCDAGFDFKAEWVKEDKDLLIYGTGVRMAIPKGYVGLLYPRSSISKRGLSLCNSVGVVDSGYRGEIQFRFRKELHCNPYIVGERIGQLVVQCLPSISFEEVYELPESEDKRNGGFGSSGV